jgi:hypothetical protein
MSMVATAKPAIQSTPSVSLTMITIRLDPALHMGLKEVACRKRTSMNQTAIGALRELVMCDPVARQIMEDEIERRQRRAAARKEVSNKGDL